MGKPKLFILFDQTVCVAGGALSGRLEIEVDDPFTCCGVDSLLNVSENVYPEPKKGQQTRTRAWHEELLTMWRPEGENLALRKGIHAFPFSFLLPSSLPSAFESAKINMQYSVKCIVHPPEGQPALESQRNAFVVENLCSASHVEIAAPSSAQAKKRLLFGGQKEIALTISSNKSVFSGGEPVYLSLGIDNQSKKKVRGIKLALRRVVELRADSKHRTVLVKSVSKRSFSDRDYRIHPHVRRNIVVDFVTPSTVWSIQQTDLFSVSYVLTVSLETSFSKNLSVDLQLRIVHPASYNSIFFPSTVAPASTASADLPPISPRLAYEVSYGLPEGGGTPVASSASEEAEERDADSGGEAGDASGAGMPMSPDEGLPVYTYQYAAVDPAAGTPVYYAAPSPQPMAAVGVPVASAPPPVAYAQPSAPPVAAYGQPSAPPVTYAQPGAPPVAYAPPPPPAVGVPVAEPVAEPVADVDEEKARAQAV